MQLQFNIILFYPITPNTYVTETAIYVLDSSCSAICKIGGIAGGINDGEAPGCEGFANAEFIETIWSDPR